MEAASASVDEEKPSCRLFTDRKPHRLKNKKAFPDRKVARERARKGEKSSPPLRIRRKRFTLSRQEGGARMCKGRGEKQSASPHPPQAVHPFPSGKAIFLGDHPKVIAHFVWNEFTRFPYSSRNMIWKARLELG
jgi:hypothetical protein